MLLGLRKSLGLSSLIFVLVTAVCAQDTAPAPVFAPSRVRLAPPPRIDDSASDSMRSGYVLGPDDEISVRALEAEEISTEALRIDLGGFISLPLIGRVRAAGRTLEQLEADLTRRLKFYVRDPQVSVGISQFRSQPVSVLGAVNKPGVHQLEGRKTLIEILSLAGGLREDAGHKVKITRRLEWGAIPLAGAAPDPTGRFSTAEVNLRAVLEARNPQQNILIMPHDVITVPRAEMIYVIGGVHRSGGFVLNERESITVLQALALAGGLQGTAKKKAAKILRRAEPSAQRTEIAVNLKGIMAGTALDVPLKREDILFVPHSGGKVALRRAAEASVNLGTGLMIWRVGR